MKPRIRKGHRPQAGAGVGEAVLPLGEGQQAEALVAAPGEGHQGDEKKRYEQQVLIGHGSIRSPELSLMLSQKLMGWLSKNFVLQGLAVFQGRRPASGRSRS
jgi:hypothetical protein